MAFYLKKTYFEKETSIEKQISELDEIREEMKDPTKARKFLVDAGICNNNGELTEYYR